ncbi:glutamate-ammonia ligase [Streptococcus pneumoniae]|nr:glutamate-ammonia ligase [Streptococcus pneumoniae]
MPITAADIRREVKEKNVTFIRLMFSDILGTMKNITDQTCNTSIFISPREDCPCIQVRVQVHIRLIDTYKTFNRRSIKHNLVRQDLI